MKQLKIKGFLNGITASVSYGTNPLFALPLFAGGIGVNSVLFYRYFFAVVIYAIWLLFVKKISFKITGAESFWLFVLGILFSLSSLTLFEAFKYLEPGIACTILFVYPIFVALIMTIFFKEKISKLTVFSIFLTFFGINLLYSGENNTPISFYGTVMVLLSALVYALYIVGVKKINAIKHLKSDKLTFYVMLFGLLVYIINLKFCTELQMLTNIKQWLCVIMLALFPTVLSIETINIAIKLIGSTNTAILGALEPLTAMTIGILFFKEQLTLKIALGVIIILFGVSTVVLRGIKKETP